MGIIRKAYGNAVVLKAAFQSRGVAYATPEKLRRMRDRRVRWLVRYAARTVPHYREFFNEQGIDPRDIHGAGDLSDLPLLDKAMVAEDPARFRSQSHHGRRALQFRTSGSTGEPLDIYHDRRSVLENIAYSAPERAVTTVYLGHGFTHRTLRINRGSSTLGEVQAFCAANTLIPGKPQRHRVDVTAQPGEVIERVRELRPEILGGYGAYLELLFRYLQANDIEMPLPRLISYGAEGMTLSGRRLITEKFGIPVVANYSAVECFKIGFQCGRGPHYHIHEDLCHLRIVGRDGRDQAPGGVGNVVVTNLVNRGMVLLNYRLGDVAALGDRDCACGRTLVCMTGLQGRKLDAIVMPGGSFIHAGAVWSVLARSSGVVRYQLIQQALDRFEVQLVTVDGEAYERFKTEAVPELQALFGPSAQISVTRHEQILPGSSGKFRPIMSKCRRDANDDL
jgi:phenylacetate-CoA ligase